MASGFFGVLLDLIFPPRCVFCGKLLHTGEKDICAHCQSALPWLAAGEAEQRCEFISLCVSPLRYQDAVRASLHRYKFKGQKGYAETYGKLVGQCVKDHLKGKYDLITWVPLSQARLKQRGYDQAMLLAMAAALALDGVAVETLRKKRNTNAQSGISGKEARRANVLDAYEAVDPELVRDKRVLLIDDIITTGSTASECARTLRTIGAADIVCATLARAH